MGAIHQEDGMKDSPKDDDDSSLGLGSIKKFSIWVWCLSNDFESMVMTAATLSEISNVGSLL